MKENLYKLINLNNLKNNAQLIKQKFNGTKIYAVIKGNAYGHNLKQCVISLNNIVDGFITVNNTEAIKARKYTDKSIVVIGSLLEKNLTSAIKHNIEFTIQSSFESKLIEKYAKKNKKICKIHIKIDTGMHRLGLHTNRELKKIVNFIKNSCWLELAGVCSHMGGDENGNRTKAQFIKFNEILNECNLFNIPKHIANTETLFLNDIYGLNIARVGIGLYGYGNKDLQPVMGVFAKILHISHIKAGEFAGYGTNFVAKKNMRIAVLNIGYAQGFMRIYAKRGYVLINGKKAKIIANICMDMTIVDISNIKNVKIGDYAVILGKSKNKEITAKDIAKKCKTIEYEILTNFNLITCTKYC